MNQEKIGNLIKKIRKQNSLTQKEFADKYGVTYQAVSKWENGKNIPDIALIKQISSDFNIDIEDILEGKIVKRKNHKIILIISILIVLTLLVSVVLLKQDNFSFKTLSSTCSNYTITGSIAYNNKKSSIYISDINYCGKNSNIEYTKIDCTLYEKDNKEEKIISKNSYTKPEPIKLDEYLKNLSFKVDNYKSICKKYDENSLFIKIKTTDSEGKTKNQIIKLSLEENC